MNRIAREEWIAFALVAAVVVATVAAVVALAGCGARPTFAGGMPGLQIPIADAPSRHSDGGAER